MVNTENLFKNWEEIIENEETLSFKTYKNYLQSIENLIIKTYPNLSLLKEKLDNNCDISPLPELEFEKIKSLLLNCWHTELNLLLPDKAIRGLIRYSVHWAPVQAYYAIYLAIRALAESSKHKIKNTHDPTLGFISNWIVSRGHFPYPWACYSDGLGDLKSCKFYGFVDLFGEKEVRELIALSSPSKKNYELFVSKFLKTTREHNFILKKKRATKIKTKSGDIPKRFFKAQKEQIEKEMTKTTIFDCLYRLRIKSNYEEAETYILSKMSDDEAQEFYNSLKIITSHSLFVIEYLIIKYIGIEKFRQILSEFEKVKRTTLFDEDSIFLRKQFY